MKKTDIAMIILIASLSALTTFLIVRATPMGKANDKPVNVKTIEKIDSSVAEPDKRIFNENALNPAVEIQINQPGQEGQGTDQDKPAGDNASTGEN